MRTRTWLGGTDDWTDGSNWGALVPDSAPIPGDTAVITTGTVVLTANTGPNPRFENNTVNLGGTSSPTLLLRGNAPTGRYFSVSITGSATLEAGGRSGFAGSITGSPNDGSTITLKADAGGELVLLHGGSFNVADRTVDLEGDITLERSAMISGDVVINGTLSVLSGRTVIASNQVTGSGAIVIGAYGELSPGPLAATQTVQFAGPGATLDLAYNMTSGFGGHFAATVKDFAPGDFIVFTGFGPVTSAALDTKSHVLTIADASNSYTFGSFYGTDGALAVATRADGFSQIGYAGRMTPLDEQIGAGARAMHADLAHAMTVPGTATPITGAGIKVGIISDSYNLTGGAAADVARGYLPAGVTVLREGASGGDEGRAMAELVHQTAPGASLFFDTDGGGVSDFAASVRALQAAGCTVIVDDIGFANEPFFQLGSPAEDAISEAIAAGVTYVTAAGNFGDAVYDSTFTTTPRTLADGSVVQAMVFGNGTTTQSITAIGGLYDTIDLQWDAPFYGVGNIAADQPGSVAFQLFDPVTGQVVGTSHQVSVDGHLVAESELSLPGSNSSVAYNLVVHHVDGTPNVGRIKYVIAGFNTGSSVGGRINERDAGVGSGAIFGHQLVPGVITVAAADVVNTPALGRTPDFAEYFSSTGPGTLLFDADGNRLAQPETAGAPDVTGPDGVQTSVPNFTPFFGTSAAAPNVAGVVALMQQVQFGIAPAVVASLLAQSALPFQAEAATMVGAGLVQADRAIMLEEAIACYCAGALIKTDRGDRPVEMLAVDDVVVTAFGRLAPIVWVGRRSYAGRFLAGRLQLQPIRFRVGSLGNGLPRRDLLVSPEHSMFLDDVLVPARHLVNGATIIRECELERVDYFHVELDSHDVLLAEGAPSESFVDDDSRGIFHNAAEWDRLHPGRVRAPAVFCAPRVESGPQLEAIRRRLSRLGLGDGRGEQLGPMQPAVRAVHYRG